MLDTSSLDQCSRTPDHTVCEIVRAFDKQGWEDIAPALNSCNRVHALCAFTSQLLGPVMWSGWVELLSDPCAVVPQKLNLNDSTLQCW